jgi:hypothetical protein
MGQNLNEAGDAMSFPGVLDSLIDPIVRATGSLDYDLRALPVDLRTRALEMITSAAKQHRHFQTGARRWGFKNPRQMFILPLLSYVFPNLIFVHVVRDGRDMLFSANQNQPQNYYSALFREPYLGGRRASGRFWATVNLEVATCGERILRSRYLRVRIEDLSGSKRRHYVRRLARALGLKKSDAITQSKIFATQLSFGRWKCHDDDLSEMPKIFHQALTRFGYP